MNEKDAISYTEGVLDGKKAQKKADVEWLKEHRAKRPAFHTFDDIVVEDCVLIKVKDWQEFVGE